MSREITESRRAWLAGEVEVWRTTGLVDPAQADALLGLYATPEELGRARSSRALDILASLAALLVGLSVLLLIGFNWEALPTTAKVSLVVAGLLGTHALGLALRYRLDRPHAGEVAFFLGCVLYGAGMWLTAQAFHLSANDGAAWWWWALGVLPFALACDGLALHALYVALLATWVGVEVISYHGLGAWLFGRWPGVPNGAYSLVLMVAPGVAWAYRKRSPRALGLYLPLVAWWAVLQPIAWRQDDFPVYLILAVGALLLMAAELHREGSPMGVPYRGIGTMVAGGALVPLSFYAFNEGIGHWRGVFSSPTDALVAALIQPLAILVLGVGVIAVVTVVRRHAGTHERPSSWAEAALGVARREWLPTSLVILSAGLALWRVLMEAEPLLPTVAANVAMLVMALWLVTQGLRDDQGVPFGAGVVYFLLWATLRYIDLFGEFGGMLGAAGMFFLCGATLFAVVVFWRSRSHRLPDAKPAPLDPDLGPEVSHASV